MDCMRFLPDEPGPVASVSAPVIFLKCFEQSNSVTGSIDYKVTIVIKNKVEESERDTCRAPSRERGYVHLPSTEEEEDFCRRHLSALTDLLPQMDASKDSRVVEESSGDARVGIDAVDLSPRSCGERIVEIVHPIFVQFGALNISLKLGLKEFTISRESDASWRVTLTTLQKIATGGYATVYVSTNIMDPKEGIASKILKTPSQADKYNSAICDEFAKLEKFGGHRGIQDKPISVLVADNQMIGFEMVRIACNLNTAVRERESGIWHHRHNPNPLLLQDLFDQLLSGLEFLHDNCLRHGDIKLQNIFLKKNIDNRWDFQISDFGLSRHYHEIFRNEDGTHKEDFANQVYGNFTMYNMNIESMENIREQWKLGVEEEKKLKGSGEEYFRKGFTMMLQEDISNLGRCFYMVVTKDNLSRLHKEKMKPKNIERELLKNNCPKEIAEIIVGMIDTDNTTQLTVKQALSRIKGLTFPTAMREGSDIDVASAAPREAPATDFPAAKKKKKKSKEGVV